MHMGSSCGLLRLDEVCAWVALDVSKAGCLKTLLWENHELERRWGGAGCPNHRPPPHHFLLDGILPRRLF